MTLTKTAEQKSVAKKKAISFSAAVLKKPGKVEKQQKDSLPKPKKGEVRIALEGCGVCASNIPIWEGRDWFNYPVSPGEPGHEGWGRIDALGEGVDNFQLGDRVTALSYHAYATHDIAKASETVKLPEELEGKPFPGEPLGCAMNIFSRSDVRVGQKVAVVGIGFLGSLLIQLCKSAGAEVYAVSRRAYSLEVAKNSGADHMVLMDDHQRVIDQLKELTNGEFCDRVIECTGKEWPLNLSIELCAERAKLIVAGFHQDGMRSVNVQMLNWKGIDMISAHERDPKKYVEGIQNAIQAVLSKKLDPYPLLTHQFDLSEMEDAYQHLVERPDGFIKAIINTK